MNGHNGETFIAFLMEGRKILIFVQKSLGLISVETVPECGDMK